MRPFGIFLFSAIIVCLLVLLALFFPTEGIRINEEFTLNFYSYNPLKDTLEAEKPLEIVLEQQIDIDTIPEANLSDSIKIVPLRKDSLLRYVQRIEFGEGGKEALQQFFRKAVNAKSKGKLVRIMHYGDSQIEGDRITSYLRSKLQKKFGGQGVGMVPVIHVADFSFPIIQKTAGSWKRNTIYGRRNKKIEHSEYGVLHSLARFSPTKADSLACDTIINEATVWFSKSPIAYSNTRTFQRVKVFLKNRKCETIMSFIQNDETLKSVSIDTGSTLKYYSYQFPNLVSDCKISFSSNDSPEVLGIALDPVSGIVVDNIALRGSAGDVFTRGNWSTMQGMYNRLDVELFILQFGGNKVPFIKNEQQARWYGSLFKKQIRMLQKMRPDAAIIVIGPADMSRKEKEQYISYEMLVPVRDALRQAAISSGAAYWDMFTAMGGSNSMPGWVAAEPALASQDHIHFTTKGAKVVAQMFYNALILEYNALKTSVVKKEKSVTVTKELKNGQEN